jgi:hypothetical protein
MLVSKFSQAVVILITVFLQMPLARGQSAEDFYKGKHIYLQIGSGVGGGYDIIGRLFSRYIGKYIPGNPLVSPQNIPGGGSLALANNFANVSPRDGSVFGIFNTGMILTPLLTPSVVKFDPRNFGVIGSPAREAHVLISWHTAPITGIEDVFKREIISAATAPGGAPFEYPLLTNKLLGSKFKIVNGYRSSHESRLAMERGEVHAIAGHGWASVKSDYADDIAKKRINVIAAFGMKQHPDLLDVPLFPLGKTEEDRQLFNLMYSRQVTGRPFMTPPEVPKVRLEALREAYARTVKDQAFLEEAKKFNIDIDPVYFEELEGLIKDLYATPKSVIDQIQKILASEK